MSSLPWIVKVQRAELNAASLLSPTRDANAALSLTNPARLLPSLTIASMYCMSGEIMCNEKMENLMKTAQ